MSKLSPPGSSSASETRALFLIGTRPELIKMAPVLWAASPFVDARVCFTGQHTDLVDSLAPVFGIAPSAPELRLSVMQPGQTLTDLTTRLLVSLDAVLDRERPDLVVAQGDTTTVLAGALAAFYRKIPFAHIEAGLRTNDFGAPFPEEANRRLASVVTSMHFAPTHGAVANLRREGIPDKHIRMVGNTVVDAVRAMAARLPPITRPQRRQILFTTHRRESFGAPLERLLAAIRTVARLRPDVDVLWPVHPNPIVRRVARELSGISNVRCVEPMPYLEMIDAIRRSTLVLTDSGGLQEEAPSLGVPVLVLRDTTERPEGVEVGVASLVGTDVERIVIETLRLLDDEDARLAMTLPANPYGDGFAGERISACLGRGLPSLFGESASALRPDWNKPVPARAEVERAERSGPGSAPGKPFAA